jgi:chromosome segregation ATPase
VSQQTELGVFDPLKNDVVQLVARIPELRVVDHASNIIAAEHGSKIKALQKAIEARRDDLVRPLNTEVKRVNAYAKEIQAPLEDAERHLKKELAAFATVEAQRKAAERQKAEEAARAEKARIELEQKERDEAMAAAGVSVAPEQTETEIAEAHKVVDQAFRAQARELARPAVPNVKQVWKFEVVDPSAVPREFLMVDEQAIRRFVASGGRDLSGVRIYSEASVALRASS